mmetsp:Transcript_27335/g.83099  ORF Transcript_27335/g.83099 Transcript_27335/m.83099 type:complete len:268 (-) Transcript_27335:668-1471(-)
MHEPPLPPVVGPVEVEAGAEAGAVVQAAATELRTPAARQWCIRYRRRFLRTRRRRAMAVSRRVGAGGARQLPAVRAPSGRVRMAANGCARESAASQSRPLVSHAAKGSTAHTRAVHGARLWAVRVAAASSSSEQGGGWTRLNGRCLSIGSSSCREVAPRPALAAAHAKDPEGLREPITPLVPLTWTRNPLPAQPYPPDSSERRHGMCVLVASRGVTARLSTMGHDRHPRRCRNSGACASAARRRLTLCLLRALACHHLRLKDEPAVC